MVYRTVYKKQEVVVEGGGIRYIYPGKSTNLYVKVSYVKGDLSYKWYKGNIWDENPELIGSERTLTVAEEGYYYCVVSNGKSDDYVSYDVRLDDGFELISKGGIIEVSAGKTIILNAEAKIVVGDLIYQWYKNGVALEEENTPFLETSVVPQEGVDKYTCIVTNDASGWGDKKEVSYWVCADAKKMEDDLSVNAPDRVAVEYGEDATLSVNVASKNGMDKLTYKWYVYGGSYYSKHYTFVSKRSELKLYSITTVKKYKCVVSDGLEEKSVEILVDPKEKIGRCAEDLEHAKILTVNAPCSVGSYNGENVCLQFTPDKTGIGEIYYDESGIYGGQICDAEGRNLCDNGSWVSELQAGKTYTVYFWSESEEDEIELTVHAKYLGDEHVWNSGTITKRPTGVETGVKTYTCLECQATYTEEIPATGVHTMTTVVDRAATCGAAGSQHRECTVCHTREASTSIPVTGAHKFGAYTVTQQPTVLATGTQVRTCSVCGKTESASIPKLSGTMTLKVNSLPLQLKKTIELRNVVTGLMAGDSIVSCSSNNTKVATVSPTGKVTAKKAGKATITITLASGVSRSMTVKVQKGAVKTSKISGVASKVILEAGKSLALSPVVTPLTTKDKLSYSSSNKKVAKVSKSGVITAKASGKAKITIKSGRKKFVVTVTVPKKAPTDMQGVPATKSLKKGKSFTIKAKLLPTGAEAKVTYKSSNKKVATVNAKGKVTAKKAGTAVITVTAGGIKQTCIVTAK